MRLTSVEIERVDIGSTNISSFVDNLERNHIGVKDERSRVAEDDGKRDTRGSKEKVSQSYLFVPERQSLPKEGSASGRSERIARASADNDRSCESE